MKKVKTWLKVIAFSLAIILVVQMLPLSSIATQFNALLNEEEIFVNEDLDLNVNIIGEVESLRDEYTKHFRCEDGSYILATYNEPVHYRVNDEWEEIDNTLVSNEGFFSKAASNPSAKYSITKTSTPITFPENINNDKITITSKNNIISFGVKSDEVNTESIAEISSPEKLTTSEILNAEVIVESQSNVETDEKLISNVQNSALVYPNAFDNAYLEYETSSSMIKESIVVPRQSNNYRYEFSIDFGDYHPIANDNRSIYIYETPQSENAVMAIAPPYMFDSNNETSDLVTMELVQNESDYTLVIEADAEWINSEDRSFPVVIDPTFILDFGRSSVRDTHVNKDNPNTNYDSDYQIEVGRRLNNIFRAYIKYVLPDLPDCSVVTKANLKLIQNWARIFSNKDIYLNVYQCNSNWDSETIKWNNQPIQDLSSVKPIDYTNFVGGMSAEYNLDITKIVKNWYEHGNNFGLMLASSDESVKEKTSFYSSGNILEKYPIVTIQYVNNIGVEDYWTYEGFSLGKSGSAYVNTYNGALTYVHNDVNTNGLLAPLNISHVYNNDERSAFGTYGNMSFGQGFKLNIIEKIELVDSSVISNYPYKYIDADGTVHFFEQDSSGYHYEFDSSVRLTVNSSSYIMTFGDGSTKTFNSSGYLTKTKDANGNTITIAYTSGRITSVTDGGGLSVELKYDTANNKLIKIIDAAGRTTHYNYNENGQLSEITYPDASKTVYEYDDVSGLISKITAYDNMQATLSYKHFGNAYKVSSYSTFGNNPTNNLYDTITFEYRTNDTVISNTKEDVLILAFDNSGRVINCILNNKTISVNQYKNATNNKNGFNNLSFSSQRITPKPNLTDQMPITSYIASTGGNYAVSETCFDVLYNERTSLKFGFSEGASPGNYYRFSELPLVGNKTYSFSAYVNIENTLSAGSLYMKVEAKNESGEIISTIYSERLTTTDNQWKLLSATMNTPAETTSCKISYGIFDGVGIFYSESLYAEESDVISHYNFIDGSSFSSDWEHSPFHRWFGNFENGISATTNSLDGSRALMISGNPRAQRYVYQSLAINGKANDVLVYGGSAKALCSASGNNNGDSDRFFGIRLKLYNDGTLVQNSYVQFNKEAMDTFQTVMSSMVAQQDYTLYRIELCYNYEINSAVFDDIFLYRTPYGTYYEYDSNGRIKTVSDDNGNKTAVQYSGVDIVGVTATANGATTQTASYTYDSNHNLTSAVGMDGVETSYTYNSKGLPTSVTISDSSGQNSTTTYKYTTDNNFLESVTDAAGSITQYEYDTEKGLVTKVIDPNGNETVYEYDPDNDQLISVSNPSSELENPSTTFEYDPASSYEAIYNDENGYYFFNDSFGRLEVINSMDSSYYWVNEYNEDGNIDFQCIGYYDWADYTYNDDGRLTSESYNDTLYYEYAYTNSGKLGRLTDHDNDVVWDYQYDFAGRAKNAFSNDGKKVSYEYTDKNELGEIFVSEDSSVMLDTRYSYDQYGRPSSVETVSMSGSPTQSYSYDTLGRTNKISNEYSSNSKVEQNISYVVNGSNQTGRIDTISYQKNSSGTVTNIAPSLRYDYDANGNITHIYENDVLKIRYHYDGLNRLSREDNSDIDKTVVYNYDRFGNILSKVEYALTFGELGTAINSIPYEYRLNYDAVTKYGNDAMGYDLDGTAVRYRGYTMEWFKGSQLSELSGNGLTMSFKYDSNGIRTKKTVNDVETEYFYVGDTLVSQKTGNETINFAYTAGGTPYGLTYNGTSYFYLTNIQGDIIGIYDTNGNVVVEYTYDTWGKLILITGSLADTIGVKNPLRYRGYYYDTETSLYYLQARYYDPDICRFISPDTLPVAGNDYIQGMNRYAYCYNNPVMYSDPTGHENEKWVADLVTVLAGFMYFGSILSESELEEFVKEYIVPSKDDLEALANGLTKMIHSMYISEFLGSLAGAGENIGTVMDIGELAGASFGAAGYIYIGFTGLMEIASVAFDPFSSTDDLISVSFSVVNGFLGGALTAALAVGAMSLVISSGGTGLWALGAGVLTYFVAGDIIDYLLYES